MKRGKKLAFVLIRERVISIIKRREKKMYSHNSFLSFSTYSFFTSMLRGLFTSHGGSEDEGLQNVTFKSLLAFQIIFLNIKKMKNGSFYIMFTNFETLF